MPIVLVLVATCSGLIFLAAAVGKARGASEFARTLRGFGIPAQLTAFATVGVVAVEAATGLALLWGQRPLLAGVMGCVLSLALICVSSYAMVRNLNVACSCFGTSHKRLGRSTLPLAVCLFVVLAGYVLAASRGSAPDLAMGDVPLQVAFGEPRC